jgi:hypothetical protein
MDEISANTNASHLSPTPLLDPFIGLRADVLAVHA